MMDDRSWTVPTPGEETPDLCGTRLHFAPSGPDWRCELRRGHHGDHLVHHNGLWYDLPAEGLQFGDEGVTAGLAWAHVTFGNTPQPAQLPELQATPDAARCVLDLVGDGAYHGYAGEWARQLLIFAFKCDQENRALLAMAFPEWVAAVWLYERDPVQLRTVATFDTVPRSGGEG